MADLHQTQSGLAQMTLREAFSGVIQQRLEGAAFHSQMLRECALRQTQELRYVLAPRFSAWECRRNSVLRALGDATLAQCMQALVQSTLVPWQ